MISIPDHIKNLVSYKPGKPIQELRREYKLDKMAKLASNENTLGSSPKALEAMKKAMEELHWYPEPAGIDAREKIAEHIGVTKENIVLGNGSEGIINYIFKCFFQKNDEIVTSEGSFIGVYVLAQAYNVPCKKVPLTTDYAFFLDGILANITPKTKAIYLSNPNNPTGTMITKSELDAFMAKVPKNILVILDEAYYEFASFYSEEYPVGTDYLNENVLVLRTFSKAYGLAGIRIGYAVGAPYLIEVLAKVKLTFEPSVIAQAAAFGAIQDDAFLSETLENAKIGRAYYYEEFDRLGVKYIPSYANFIMTVFESEEIVQELNAKLLQRGVVLRPLNAFGLPHCLRITIGTPEENKMCITQLETVLKEVI